MKFSLSMVKDLLPFVAIAVGGFPGAWLLMQYQHPQIVYYADGYYARLGDDVLIGTIYIVNEGRSPETNLSVLVSEKLSPSDIAINYVSAKAEVRNEGNQTRITIPTLKPNESAEIVFKASPGSDSFAVDDITSSSGNIRHQEWLNQSWWNLTRFQLGIVLIAVAAAFAIGYGVGIIKNDLISGRSKIRSTARKKPVSVG